MGDEIHSQSPKEEPSCNSKAPPMIIDDREAAPTNENNKHQNICDAEQESKGTSQTVKKTSRIIMTTTDFTTICGLVLSTLTVVMVTTTAVIYYGQLKEMQKATQATQLAAKAAEKAAQVAEGQLDQMKSGSEQTDTLIKQVERIADASAENAKQSRDALDATIQAARTDQRAWVYYRSLELSAITTTAPTKINFELFNGGKTYARNLITNALVAVSLRPIDDEIVAQAKATMLGRSNPERDGAIFPQQGIKIPAYDPVPLTQDKINSILSGEVILCLVSDVSYDDVYQTRHTTTCFAIYNPTEKRFELQGKYCKAD